MLKVIIMNYLYDNTGKRIGQTTTINNKNVMYDNTGRRIATYDKKLNSTYDKNGKRVGWGDQTSRFLK